MASSDYLASILTVIAVITAGITATNILIHVPSKYICFRKLINSCLETSNKIITVQNKNRPHAVTKFTNKIQSFLRIFRIFSAIK